MHSSPKAVAKAYNQAAINGDVAKLTSLCAYSDEVSYSDVYDLHELLLNFIQLQYGGIASCTINSVEMESSTTATVYDTTYYNNGAEEPDYTYVVKVDGEWWIDVERHAIELFQMMGESEY